MARLRRSALIRVSTLLLLIWVGFDIGAHGLFVSDFAPVAVQSSSISFRASAGDRPAAAQNVHDHCFCHSVSVGAVLPTLPVSLAPTGAMVVPLSARGPRGDGNPLDHPPQLAA